MGVYEIGGPSNTDPQIVGFPYHKGPPIRPPKSMLRLSPLSAILLAMSANPSNPVFNHYLFEARAARVSDSCAAALQTHSTRNPRPFCVVHLVRQSPQLSKCVYQHSLMLPEPLVCVCVCALCSDGSGYRFKALGVGSSEIP